jgi:hypothetical protein
MLQEPDSLRFASEATTAGMWAVLCFAGAGVTVWADRRRAKRANIDKPGWVPWAKLFFAFALVGAVLFAMAVKGWATA